MNKIDGKLQAMVTLAAVMSGEGIDDVLDDEERAAQSRLSISDSLPIKGMGKCPKSLGLVWDKGCSDPLFVEVKLPIDWKKVPTDHPMWTHLVDHMGRKRAAIFYKSALWDNEAFIQWEPRYGYKTEYVGEYEYNKCYGIVTDGGEEIFRTEEYNGDECNRASDLARAGCLGYLDRHFPDWENPDVYW